MPYHFPPRALPENDYPGADLVAHGGQMLVSQRLRGLIEALHAADFPTLRYASRGMR